MKVNFSLFIALIFSLLMVGRSEAASVQYRDENGKVHYVNTDYAKVPDRYLGQVADQLQKINEEKIKNTPVPTAPVPAGDNTPQQTQKRNNAPEPIAVDTTPSAQVTNENRLTRLTDTLTELQISGYFPPSVNINSGVIGYIDRQGQKVFVTPQNLSSVNPEYLPQVDAQIISLEKIAKQARKEKPLIPGTTVEVFTKESCSECVKLLTLLQVHSIPYLNFDVNNTSQGMEFYKSMNNADLPITRVKNTIINGVDIGGIKKALNPQTAASTEATQQPELIHYYDTTQQTSAKSTEMRIESIKLQKPNLTVNHLLGTKDEK